MATTPKQSTARKYTDIRDGYIKWLDKKYKGTQKYTDAYIFLVLSEKYYLSPRTIENIVFSRIGYTDTAQMSLFPNNP